MATLAELIAQKEALEHQIEEVHTKGRTQAIEKIRALMLESNLTVADLGGKSTSKSAKPSDSTRKVAAKYRNASTGESWSGRGLQPRWLKSALASGKKIGDFAV